MTTIQEVGVRVRKCPKCGSKLWNVIEYSAVTGLFHLFVVIVNIQKLKNGFIQIRKMNKK